MQEDTFNGGNSDFERFNSEILASSELQECLKTATKPESLISLVVELGYERGYSFTKEEVIDALAIETALGKDYQEYSVPLKSGAVVAGCACGNSSNPDDDVNSDDQTTPCVDSETPGDDMCLLDDPPPPQPDDASY